MGRVKDSGQLSLFDLGEKKPYSYSFKRYVGQKVVFNSTGEVWTVKRIEPYYTICSDGKSEVVGINVTIHPLDPAEWGNNI